MKFIPLTVGTFTFHRPGFNVLLVILLVGHYAALSALRSYCFQRATRLPRPTAKLYHYRNVPLKRLGPLTRSGQTARYDYLENLRGPLS